MPTFETVIYTQHPERVFDAIADLSMWSTFRGWGPLPGIVKAELIEGERVEAGALVRVTNTDGSVHHERFERFDPGRSLRIRFELGPPPTWILSSIVESINWDGEKLVRRMEVTPRSPLLAPLAWIIASLLARAVAAHNRVVQQA